MRSFNKKIMRITILIIAIFCLFEIIICNNHSNAATSTVDGLTWNYTVSGSNAINVYVSSGTPGSILTIPSTLDGYTVTSIRGNTSRATSSAANILNTTSKTDTVKEVVIPDTVTSIGWNTFSNFTGLESITIPDSVEVIDLYAFQNCSSLKSLNLGKGVKEIKDRAFYNCSAIESELSLPDTLTTIGSNTFYNSGISGNLNIPSSVTSIGSYAFYNCRNLTGLQLQEGLISIGTSAFSSCNSLKGDLVIPNSVTSLGSNSFENCTSFDGTLSIGNGVRSIERNTFNGDTNFKKATIGTSVKNIYAYAFSEFSDIWINNIKSNVTLNEYFGGDSKNTYVHWLDETHSVTVSTIPGVKIVNAETGEILTSGEYLCESSFNYKVVIENGYNYNNLKLIVIDNSDYDNYSSTDVDFNATYTFNKLIRNREIYVQDMNDGLDLSLRTFVTAVNRNSVSPRRTPVVKLIDGKLSYLHTKYPVTVKKGDLVTYKIRVYNEGANNGTAKRVTLYIPEGLEFEPTNITNVNNKWVRSGNVISTDILANEEIKKYSGNCNPNYKDIEVILKVTQDKNEDSDIRLNTIAEIAESSEQDVDATNNSIKSAVSSEYKEEESYNSNSSSYILGNEDDDDFDSVVIIGKIKVDYAIKINKIDTDTKELLKGATFNLLNENEEVIKTATTDENGALDFGTLTTFGEGEDIYYIEETQTPEGYIPIQDRKLKVTVIKTIIDEDKGTYSVKVVCESLDYNIDTTRYEFTPIKTVDQLKKIGSGEVVTIDGVEFKYNADSNYKLMEDLDLAGDNWTPINRNLRSIIDGNNHKISNLTITSDTELNISEVGLFGEFSGIIQNLELNNVNINIKNFSEDATNKSGYTGVGAFAGIMSEGSILNCKVSGNIEAECDNVGGFVGYTAKGKIVKVQNSTNYANVTSSRAEIIVDGAKKYVGGSNSGGFIGCALGALSVKDSVNEGAIIATNYNAGGIAGYTEATEYIESDIIADFDEGDKSINLVVENKNIQGQYKVFLQNTDARTLGLLPGGVYKVLDADKKEISGLGNVTLNTGRILLTTVNINTLGTDVYYIKEVSPAEGYEKLNSYIKLRVTRYWDEELKDYRVTIGNDFVPEEDIDNDDANEEEEGLPSNTGNIFTKVDFVNATWNSNKAEFSYCINKGAITASNMNAAGIVGNSHCIVDINNCQNSGEIYSMNKAGGIISELQTDNLNKYSNIKSCNNTGIVTSGNIQNVYARGSAGGIASNIIGDVKVISCTNNAAITSNGGQAAAGIVADMLGGLIIESCENNGAITNQSANLGNPDTNGVSGGIVGKNMINLNEYKNMTRDKFILKVSNCNNYGDVKAVCHLGGIVGASNAINVEISDCEVKDININDIVAGDKGGIIGHSANNKIIVTNCNIDSVNLDRLSKIHNTYGGTAGIIGCVSKYSGQEANIESITVRNCNVTDCVFKTIDKETAGIIGSENAIEGITMNYISDCNVSGCTMINDEARNSYSSSAGIVGGSYGAGYDISHCVVNNTQISSTHDSTSGGDMNVAGIIGVCWNSNGLTLDNCKVLDSNINCNAFISDGCANAAGIVGAVSESYSASQDSKFSITNCSVSDTDIHTTAGNIAGILAMGHYFSHNHKYNIENCSIDTCNIISTANTDSNTDTAGIVAFTSGDIVINNCKVNNSIITGDGRNTSGVLGAALNKLEISNIDVKGSTITGTAINTARYSRTNDCVSGVIGYVGSTSSYQNIKVDNCIIKGAESGNVSGIIGCCNDFSSAFESFRDCVVSNTDITSEIEIAKLGYSVSNSTTSGLIGRISKVNMDNCDVINCNINGKGIIIAGGVASCDNITATDCSVNDTTITNEPDLKCEYPYACRVVSGFLGSTMNNAKFNNIKISDVSISGKAESAGGIYGFVNILDRLSNCIVDKLTINTHDVDAIINGASAGIGANTNQVNCTIESCNVNNSEITTDAHIVAGMFGYFYKNAMINNCKTNNVTLEHNNLFDSQYDPVVAGLVGINDESITLTSCSVKNGNLKSKEGTKDILHIGGILGFAEDDATMNNVEIINTNISNNTSGGITGGIVAMTNYIVNDTDNVVRKLNISNSKVENCKNIVGKNHVGGILGFGKLIANSNTIADIVISGTGTFGDVGGIAANTLEDTIINGVTASNINVSGIYRAGGILGFNKGDVQNVNISNSTIIATGDNAQAGGIVGLTSVLSTKIQNCIANLIEVKSVNGYVGGIIGFANNKIIDCSVTDSKIESTGAAPTGVGGIAGFTDSGSDIQNPTVSNNTLTDTALKGDYVGAPITINIQPTDTISEDPEISLDDDIKEDIPNKVTSNKAQKNEETLEGESDKVQPSESVNKENDLTKDTSDEATGEDISDDTEKDTEQKPENEKNEEQTNSNMAQKPITEDSSDSNATKKDDEELLDKEDSSNI